MRSERGSTTPLLIFYCFLGLSVIALIVAATSLYTERKRLFALADGAALAATEQFSLADLRYDGSSLRSQLRSSEVASAAASYLADANTSLRDARIVNAFSPDGSSARVTVAAQWVPPILGELFPWSLPLQVTATARTAFG